MRKLEILLVTTLKSVSFNFVVHWVTDNVYCSLHPLRSVKESHRADKRAAVYQDCIADHALLVSIDYSVTNWFKVHSIFVIS